MRALPSQPSLDTTLWNALSALSCLYILKTPSSYSIIIVYRPLSRSQIDDGRGILNVRLKNRYDSRARPKCSPHGRAEKCQQFDDSWAALIHNIYFVAS